MNKLGKLERLERAGLIKPHKLSGDDKRLIERLSDAEVDALISVKRTVGEDFLSRNTAGDDPPVGIVF
jgi:hypothetical protein